MTDAEIASFDGLWAGGYYEGDPLDPHGRSHYSAIDVRNGYPTRPNGLPAKEIGFISILYAVYLLTIRSQLKPSDTVLEIGPGRGGWTKALLTEHPKQIYALDALSAEHNKFWEYVGQADNVSYHQVEDFECTPVPDNSIDFFFSFGVFCHISRRGTAAYFRSVARKMRPGARGVCMISDYEKMGRALGKVIPVGDPETPSPGRWYHLGVDWFCGVLADNGFKVVNPDLAIIARDPIIRFEKV